MKVELKNISHCFEHRQFLTDINLTIASGQCLVVSGRSGSGKSLLFSIVCGIFKPNQGEVLIDGLSIEKMDEQQYMAFRKQCGVVFQLSALVTNLTLAENLMLPLNQHFPEMACEEKKSRVKDICYEFGLEDYMDLRTDDLSTGLASLAGLARALLLEPKCLVWDSPMSEIDLHWSEHVHNRLLHLRHSGTTFILFTNRQRIIERMADIQLDLTKGCCV